VTRPIDRSQHDPTQTQDQRAPARRRGPERAAG
jgi:hypothetical protein